jgi:hypothetical protein
MVVGGASLDLWTVPVVLEQGDPISPELKAKWAKVEGLMRKMMEGENQNDSTVVELRRTMELQFSQLRDAFDKGSLPQVEQDKLSLTLDIALDHGQRILKKKDERRALYEHAKSVSTAFRKNARERAADAGAPLNDVSGKDAAMRARTLRRDLDAAALVTGTSPVPVRPEGTKAH